MCFPHLGEKWKNNRIFKIFYFAPWGHRLIIHAHHCVLFMKYSPSWTNLTEIMEPKVSLVCRRSRFTWVWQDSSSALCKSSHGSGAGNGTHHSPWIKPGDWGGAVPYMIYYGAHTMWGTWSQQSPGWGWTSAVLLGVEAVQASGSSCSGLCSVPPISTALSSHVFMWRVPECIIVINPQDAPVTACVAGVSTTCQGQTWRPGYTGHQSSSAHSSWT